MMWPWDAPYEILTNIVILKVSLFGNTGLKGIETMHFS